MLLKLSVAKKDAIRWQGLPGDIEGHKAFGTIGEKASTEGHGEGGTLDRGSCSHVFEVEFDAVYRWSSEF